MRPVVPHTTIYNGLGQVITEPPPAILVVRRQLTAEQRDEIRRRWLETYATQELVVLGPSYVIRSAGFRPIPIPDEAE